MSEFVTTAGLIIPSVTAEEMTEMDRIAIDETGPTLLQMMENAGRNLAELVIERTAPTDIVIVAAGIGGNGGGGICAARHLSNHGRQVYLTLSRPHDLRAAADWQRHVFAATGATEIAREDAFLERTITRLDLNGNGGGSGVVIVDALLGYNAAGPAREPGATMIQTMNVLAGRPGVRIISLDVPSGIDATTGKAPGAVVSADIVLTLALPKTGLKRVAANFSAPEIVVADIGIPQQAYLALGTERPFRGRYRESIQLDATKTVIEVETENSTNRNNTER